MQQKAVWLFGENRGATMNNNSWYTFEHVVTKMRELPVEAYFALNRSEQTEQLVAELPKRVRRRILWHSGRRHRAVFERADRFFITLSFGDIEPRDDDGSSERLVPLVHLQHGTIGIKAVGYRGDYYRGTIDAFCTYNDEERALLAAHNGFETSQLFDAGFHPRYAELLRRADAAGGSRKILWFLTWRDYLRGDTDEAFAEVILRTLADERLAAELERSGSTLCIGFHQFFAEGVLDTISEQLAAAPADDPLARIRDRVRLEHGARADVMDLIAEAAMLVTDYSSVAYDMTFLGRPVALYQFDLDDYLADRAVYVDLREVFTDHVAHAPEQLGEVIAGAWGTVHPHYAERVHPVTDSAVRTWVRSGGAIEQLAREMSRRDAVALAARTPAPDAALLASRSQRTPLPQWHVDAPAVPQAEA